MTTGQDNQHCIARLSKAQAAERADDGEWTDYTLDKVTPHGDWFELGSDGTCWALDAKYGVTPEVGRTMRLYGGWGRKIRGIDYEGRPVFYDTAAERQAAHEKWVADLHARYRAEYEADRERLTAELATLPEPFRNRIERALAKNPDWAWEGMGQRYEQFALVQAARIHDHFNGDADRILAWRTMEDYAEQSRQGPELDEAMSGNQFGFAGYMAEALARGVA